MQSPTHTPYLVSLSVRFYGLLLLAYPSGFRRAYGSDMLQVFADCCRAAYRRAGAGGLPGLWARTMLDYLRTVFEEHIQRGVSMSRVTFIKISGWALAAGPISALLGWLASSRPDYSPYNAASWPVDRFLNGSDNIMIAFGLVLISLGMFGLLARYGARSGKLGQAGLLLAGLSGLASAVGVIGLSVVDSSPWWELFSIGLMLLLLGVAPFAIRCLQLRLMPRMNGLLLATTLWMPVIISGLLPNLPGVLTGVMLALNFLGISLAGYQLQRSAAGEEKAFQTA
jgi:hypothetical protein